MTERSRRLRPILASAIVALFAGGCDLIRQDVSELGNTLAPPSPSTVARWAFDDDDPELQRRGVSLLAGADFGGEDVYVELYRVFVETPRDPLVLAASIRALGRHGRPSDAMLIARHLDNESEQVRLETAIALQRLHDPEVGDLLWRALANEDEASAVRVELAIAMGQYPGDPQFQSLISALRAPELGLNLAAAESLRTLTGQDLGDDAGDWLAWYESADDPFGRAEPFLHPTYSRRVTFFERLVFWNPKRWESPSLPRGADVSTRSTYDDEVDGSETPDAGTGG